MRLSNVCYAAVGRASKAMSSALPSSRIRFATFEVDVLSGELRKRGIRIRLQDQPLKILLALLEKPGEIVTREELRERIWGTDTFVDFDHGLSAAVNRLREALGDSAENPRYVETMARRGYRFIAPMEGAQKAPVPPPAPQRSRKKLVWTALALLAAAALGTESWLTWDRGAAAPRVVRLTAFAGVETTPAFSPDGTQVAFGWNWEKQDNSDIYVMMVGSATALRLTSDPGPDVYPAWSPDGRQIAFGSRRGQIGIYLVSPLGGKERKLVDLALASASPLSWSPDGKFLAASRSYDERSGEPDNGALMLIPVEGGGEPRRILAPPPGSWYIGPAFSRDGRRLAVFSCTGAGQSGQPSCQLQIIALNAELLPQGKPREIGGPLFWPRGIAWTGDGNSLLFSGCRGSPDHYLWRASVREAGEPQRLEVAGAGASWPAIDARGHRLAFSRSPTNINIQRWEQGGKPSALLASSLNDDSPQFSHDGRRIAFGSRRSGNEMDIWVANADGTGWAQITRELSSWSDSPRWSPDDRWIAFDAQEKNLRWDIWKVEASGGPAQRLTHGPADSAVPSWSRDGKWIYFYSNRSGRTDIWRAPAQGGPAVQITRRGGFTALESTDGKTLYYTKSQGGAEGLFAMPLSGGEERQVFKDRVLVRGFAVFSDGIYYLSLDARNRIEIRFHEFASGNSRRVVEIEGPLVEGFSVSPDRKTFLFARRFPAGDLMLIENFR
jgi:Tol biopolymer transport system component/DNA-binding winged helix-turn-helix (wHTH) protein